MKILNIVANCYNFDIEKNESGSKIILVLKSYNKIYIRFLVSFGTAL